MPFEEHQGAFGRELEAFVLQGGRLHLPTSLPPSMRDVIQRGWAQTPEERPSAGEVLQVMVDLDEARVRVHSVGENLRGYSVNQYHNAADAMFPLVHSGDSRDRFEPQGRSDCSAKSGAVHPWCSRDAQLAYDSRVSVSSVPSAASRSTHGRHTISGSMGEAGFSRSVFGGRGASDASSIDAQSSANETLSDLLV